MPNPRRVVFYLTVLLVLCTTGMPVLATPGWLSKPGTIANAIEQPDGTNVCIDDVSVVKLKGHQNPAYFVVREQWHGSDMIVIYAAPSDVLRIGQDVDIEGTLDTLPSGMRVIKNPRVVGYYDQIGNMLRHCPCPPTKGIVGFSMPWEWKAELPPATDPNPTGQPVLGEPNLAPPSPAVSHDTVASFLQDAVLGTSAVLDCKKIIDEGNDPVFGDYLVIGDDRSSSVVKVYNGANRQSIGAASLSFTSTAEAGSTEEERVNNVSGQVQLVGTELALVMDGGPSFDTQGLPGGLQTVSDGTIAYAKSLADGLTANIQDVIVTEYDPLAKVGCVENADRGAGLRVDCGATEPLECGSVVAVEGTLQTNSDGERELHLTSPAAKSSADKRTLAPLLMVNRGLGGSSFNTLTPGVNYPLPGEGLNNKGLLVKICGRVTAVDEPAGCFYLDDGSTSFKYVDGVPVSVNIIAKVAWNAEGGASSIPAVGDYLAGIVGISSSEAVSPGQYQRLLRLRFLAKPVLTGTTLSRVAMLNWTPQDHATYCVYRGESESGPFSLVANINEGEFSDTGLTNGKTYYYKVCSVESPVTGAMSQVLALTPTGGAPTVDSEVDSTTSTYTYTVDCPANNEYPFGHLEVRIYAPNDVPTSEWKAEGPYMGGIDQHWSFTVQQWDPATGFAAAVWDATNSSEIPVNTAGTAVFKLVVPGSPIQGIAITRDGDPASEVSHDVIVPDGIEVTIPQNPPVSAFSLTGTLGNLDWYVSPVKVTISATDPDNDFSKSFYRLDDMTASWAEYESEIQVDTNGSHEVAAYSVDTNGNSEDPNNPIRSSFKIDAVAPSISSSLTTQPNANGWYRSNVTINYTAVDETSGLETPQTAEPGASVAFSAVVSAEGSNVSNTGSAVDKAGNTASKQITGLKIDKTAPVINVISAPSGCNYIINYSTATIRFSASDSLSGIDGMPWAVVDVLPTDGWASPSSTTVTPVSVGAGVYEITLNPQVVGVYTVKLYANDLAGNLGQVSVPVSFSAGGFAVEWLPPISTMDTYVMQDGSTIPVKFRLLDPMNNSVFVNSYLYTVKVMDSAKNVWLQVATPAPDFANSGYSAIIKTKDANNVDWPVGDYTVVIEGPGIWDVVSGPYRSRYGLQIVDKAVAKGTGRK